MKESGARSARTPLLATFALLVAAAVVGALFLSSGVVTPQSPADAAIDLGNQVLGVGDGAREGPRQRSRPRTRRRTYRVRRGDTLARVSERTGVSVRRLRALNPGLDPLTIQRGRVLRLRD